MALNLLQEAGIANGSHTCLSYLHSSKYCPANESQSPSRHGERETGTRLPDNILMNGDTISTCANHSLFQLLGEGLEPLTPRVDRAQPLAIGTPLTRMVTCGFTEPIL